MTMRPEEVANILLSLKELKYERKFFYIELQKFFPYELYKIKDHSKIYKKRL